MGQPWRKHSKDFEWSGEYSEKLKKEVGRILHGERCKPTLLVLGPSESGKSTFINSLSTISQNRKANIASSSSHTAHTTSMFRRYELPGDFEKFKISDTKGIVLMNDGNINFVENITMIINGKVRPNLEFNGDKFPESGDFYINTPQESDKVQCAVFVFKITVFTKEELPLLSVGTSNCITKIIKELEKADIPSIIVLTHADKLGTKVKDDITKIFHSEKINDAIKTASDKFGVPIENIHPIVNYSNTPFACIYPLLHIPILLALKTALYFAKDTLHKRRIQLILTFISFLSFVTFTDDQMIISWSNICDLGVHL